MREILFRGKRTDNGEWVEGDIHKNTEFSKSHIHPNGERVMSFDVIPETVGQYTGLVDKNGVRIFEGDIVKAFTRYGTEHQYAITYRAGTFWFGGWNWVEFLDRFQFPEVIGNIHDNPELMKGGE